MAKTETAQQPQTKMHFATDDHVKKNGIFYVPNSKLTVLDNFNDREDYGTTEEMNELMESIYHSGPRVPLRGYKQGESYVVIVGHRRKMAGDMAFKKYGVDILFPLVTYPPGITKQEMLMDTLLTNNGKDLNPLEKASTVFKLMEQQTPVKEITAALGGVSEVYVKNLQRLWTIPEKAKDLIRKGVVSATTIMGFLKTKGNIEEFIAEIEKQAGGEEQAAGPKKKKKTASVTRKKLEARAATSWGEFKRFRKQSSDIFETKEKQQFFEFMCSVADNQVTYSQILEFFTGKS